jgi:membrane fusion protein, multidrug efflux system
MPENPPYSTHTETSSVAVETRRHHSPPDVHFDAQPPRGNKKSHAWVWLIILAVILGAGYFMYNQYQAMQLAASQRRNRRPQSVPVTTAKARKSDMPVYVEAIGTVTPIYTDTITSRVSGQIVNISYREGQMVHKGDPLIDIDPRPYQAAVTQMEGQLAKDKAVLAEAQLDLDRYQNAYSRNAIAKQQLDDQTQLVHQDEGTVQNDTGQLENARVNLAYCHIVSPIDGRVGLRLVDPGNIVQANSTTPLVVVTQLQPITVIFSVEQSYLAQIEQQLRAGQKMSVEALDRNQETKIEDGTLLTLDNQVDVSTDTVKLRASFNNSKGMLFPNEFVNARLLLNTQRGDTVVPSNAIQRNAQGAFVYVIGSDQKAHVQNVTAGVSDDNMTAVTGIGPGVVVATTGFNQLQDGITVSEPGSGRGARGSRTADSNPSSGEQAP